MFKNIKFIWTILILQIWLNIMKIRGGKYGDITNPLNSNLSTKLVEVKIYVSPIAKNAYSVRGKSFEDMVYFVIGELERSVNSYLVKLDHPFVIKWKPLFQTEIPPGIDPDKCDVDLVSIGSILNILNMDDSMTSSILILSCSASSYNDAMIVAGLLTPYISHMLSTQCSVRTVLFFEAEEAKFISVMATGLVKAAAVGVLNPLMFEEIIDGDQGVRYEIRVSNDALEQLKNNRCFFSRI
ncbi:spore wall protein [Hamiltosporidium tvaerminnensis]|uniref:Spore wall protein n=2 Tax=Hamiltosporidium TaxID=1176354 RepID=A0A4Q9LLA5_9MICR|nr:spore wall protein [Hamiltosporidium magnivora]TBU13062.1 spore wall protein [Hamiltosporidium tvaerminnensis]